MRRACCAYCLVAALWADQKPGRVSGRVEREDTGGSLAKAVVVLYPQDDESATGGRRLAETGTDGQFTFAEVAPGSYAVTVSKNGFVPGTGSGFVPVALKAGGEVASLRLKLAPAGVIEGTVVDRDGEPIQGLSVRAQRVQYLPGARRAIHDGTRATTDDQGRFRLYGLNRGHYYLRTGGRLETARELLPLKQGPDHGLQYGDTWYPPDALTESAQPLRVGPGSEISGLRIVVKREPVWTISGRVEAEPAPTELSCTRPVNVALMYGSMETINPDGTFKIEGVEAGDYLLSTSSGYASVQVIDRNVRTTIGRGAGAEVRGRVKTEGWDPAGLEVYLYAGGMAIFPSHVGEEGDFAIRDIPPGEYRFGLRDNRYYIEDSSKAVRLSIGTVVTDCALKVSRDTGEIRGRVTANNQPVPGLQVVAIPRDKELRRVPRNTIPGKTASDGEFALRGVVPGEYWLFAQQSDWTGEVFALDFPEQNAGDGVSVEVKSGEVARIEVKK